MSALPSQGPANPQASWSGTLPVPPRVGRRSTVIFIAVAAALVLAIPGAAYAYASSQVSSGRTLEAQGRYADAVAAYRTADALVGNLIARPIFRSLADQASTGAAQARLKWGAQEQAKGNFASAETQYDAVVASGLPQWQSQANAALADLFLAWGDSLAGSKKYDEAITQYRRIKDYDRAARLKDQAGQALAGTYLAYAAALVQANPPDYAGAITWYQNLVQEFPQSPQAQEAATNLLPQTLYQQGMAYVDQKIYDKARDALRRVATDYAATSWGAKAQAALSAPQQLSGKLLQQDGTPVPNRLLRISTRWRIVSPHTYDDSDGRIYSTTTDGSGNFALMVPPGEHYLVTWWDPGRQNFVTTFIGDDQPVNLVTVDPLAPTRANFSIA